MSLSVCVYVSVFCLRICLFVFLLLLLYFNFSMVLRFCICMFIPFFGKEFSLKIHTHECKVAKGVGSVPCRRFFFTFIFGLLPFHAVLTSTQPLAAESCQNQFHSTGIMMIRLRTKGKRRGNWEGWNGERRTRLIDFRNRGPST